MQILAIKSVLAVLCILSAACCTTGTFRTGAPIADEQERFWAALASHCGQAFEGRVVEDTTGNPDFARTPLVMHVRVCESGRLLIPFHVGTDRSRTWVITRTDDRLRLKHDHRHEDGSEDEITQYGGDTKGPGTDTKQEFHADAFTASLIPAAATNVWTVEIDPGVRYAYALRREGTDRRFRVEFDLTRPVDPPPAPWGHE
ncbi:MAG: hypothetical protein LAT64_02485 [Phycisphaerales bacterium]|nr:hypothetical protein [Planctomycetota bacterium]MCH8507625.1 hypothetical protein [Phycisphaerales bacterium]